jgi:hypothetical protein
MVTPRALASLVLLSTLLSGCAVTRILRAPDPVDSATQNLQEQHLEVHLMHHGMHLEAHEAAVRLLEQMASPPPPPPAVP